MGGARVGLQGVSALIWLFVCTLGEMVDCIAMWYRSSMTGIGALSDLEVLVRLQHAVCFTKL